jgi:cyanophycinase
MSFPTPRTLTLRLALAAILALSPLLIPAAASGAAIPTFVPIGAGYTAETLEQFAAEAVEVDTSGEVSIVVLPITYGIDPLSMSNGLRSKNLSLADTRRGQIEEACLAVIPAGESCDVVLAPVLIRSDAFDPANVALVKSGLDGIYVLGGDQVVGMQVVANTPFEAALAQRQAAGAVTSGNSAGAAVESADMIAGYTGNNGPEQGLERGAVDIWTYDGRTDDTRGLVFGLQNVLLDQHVLQRGRIGRLISASYTAGELGIGVDADTAATIEDGSMVTKIGGASAVFVADSLTYRASAQFDGTGTLSIHHVTTQVLPPGEGYDMLKYRPAVGGTTIPAPSIVGRTFPSLATPASSGPLLLGGGAPSAVILDRLVAASGGGGSNIVVLAAGYAKPEIATKDAKAFAAALGARGASATWFLVDARAKSATVAAALANADGVLLTAPDPSLVLGALNGQPAITAAIHNAWLGGAALLADDAAASALSAGFTSDARPGPSTGAIEGAAVAEFRPDSVTPVAGLDWVDVLVEPGIVSNRHWGRLYNDLAGQGAAADRFGFGIDAGTAIEFRPVWSAPRVVGDSAAVALDGRSGSFGVGTNGALAAHWVILDTFVGGQEIAP